MKRQLRQPFVRILIVAAFLPLASSGYASAADLTAEMHELDSLDTVESSAIGSGGAPGEFHTLSKRFLAKGSPADFQRLANDRVPIVRAMGLYCLVRTQGEGAVPALKAKANDAESVRTQIGCIGGDMTIAELAESLIRYRELLDVGGPTPLVGPVEVLALDVTRLVKDSSSPQNVWWSHIRPIESIRHQLDEGTIKLDAATMEALSRQLAGEPKWRLVKGIGRAGPHSAIRAFLVARLGDQAENLKARLAAASALTRDPDPSAVRALQAAAAFLNGTEAGLADRLIGAAELRAQLDAEWGKNAANVFRTWPPEPPAEVRESDHPMVLEFVPPTGIGSDRAQRVPAAQYVKLVERAVEFGRAWDTYSDTALLLREMIVPEEYDFESKPVTRSLNRALRARE